MENLQNHIEKQIRNIKYQIFIRDLKKKDISKEIGVSVPTITKLLNTMDGKLSTLYKIINYLQELEEKENG